MEMNLRLSVQRAALPVPMMNITRDKNLKGYERW